MLTTQLGIVTLNLNQSDFLLEAVRSIKNQDFQNWSLIVVDPGSTDGAEYIYEMPTIASDPRIQIVLQPDSGPSEGLNNGFARLGTPYFYYLNADDRCCAGAFSNAVELLTATNHDFILGHGWIIDNFGRRGSRIFSDDFDPDLYLAGKCVAVQQSTFFRRSAFERVGGFNMQNEVSWDGELLFDATRIGLRVKTVNRYWGEFRQYPGTITSKGSTQVAAVAAMKRIRHDSRSQPLTTADYAMRIARRRISHPSRSLYLVTRKLSDFVRSRSNSSVYVSGVTSNTAASNSELGQHTNE